MIRKALTYLKEGHTFHALELTERSGESQWLFTSVKRHKDEISITESSERNPDVLAEKISGSSPLFVLINTGHVLSRVQKAVEGDETAMVNRAFPNLKMEDFYYEVARSGTHAFIAICRKEYVDNILSELTNQKINPSGFSLGALQIHVLSGFAEDGEMMTSNTVVTFRDHNLEGIRKEENLPEKTYSINGLEIPGIHLPGFSGVLGLITGSNATTSNFKAKNASFRSEFYHRRFFRLFVRGGLAFLLVLLLVNFMVFNYYFGKTEDLKQASEVNRLNKQNFMELKDEVMRKENIINDIQATSGSRSSFYTDRIITKLPPSILLREILYQPLQKQIREGEEILLEEDRIMVSGESADSRLFSEWVEALETYKWTESVSILEYGSASSGSAFSILLTLKTDQ
ncbi:hypothetical protein [Sinomicrobium weinanense]|uniref:Uncharacterized protein n=1 Tax=Sinomicrobium weinanense TaxID=2842200 RepID=A0A926JQX0_9FLAO|nr:hypothetical protein [Sinomicrobium weinanense]MBC9795845.1 hypothetical protein [Sinomicrobium weinanense]MBU3125365.1 hypothetical protein [Sinomicrobium weinanense]